MYSHLPKRALAYEPSLASETHSAFALGLLLFGTSFDPHMLHDKGVVKVGGNAVDYFAELSDTGRRTV